MGNTDDGTAASPIEQAIALADREWRSMGVVEADRAALARDLRLELTGAAADGLAPHQLLGDDVRRFAHDLAAGAGVRRAPYEFRRLLLTALVGAVPGLVLAWGLIWKHWVTLPAIVDDDSLWNVLWYVPCVAAFVVGALTWVRWRMRDSAAIGRTVRGMAVLVPVAGVLAIPVTMGFASLVGYSTALPVLVVEAAIVGGALGGATVLARRWAMVPILGTTEPPADRSSRRPNGPDPGPNAPRMAPG